MDAAIPAQVDGRAAAGVQKELPGGESLRCAGSGVRRHDALLLAAHAALDHQYGVAGPGLPDQPCGGENLQIRCSPRVMTEALPPPMVVTPMSVDAPSRSAARLSETALEIHIGSPHTSCQLCAQPVGVHPAAGLHDLIAARQAQPVQLQADLVPRECGEGEGQLQGDLQLL